MKRSIISAVVSLALILSISAQQLSTNREIDSLLISGMYAEAIEMCKEIISTDSLNAAVWYRMGLAWRNIQPDEGSFECFLKASECDPENRLYMFNTGKGYYSRNKNFRAKPVFEKLVAADTMNWDYAYYLTSILMAEGKIDRAISIYQRFHKANPGNYVFLDKLGYASMRKGNITSAADYYRKSLRINPDNTDAIRNLSFLLPYQHKIDSAIIILSNAISKDPEDIDLYARRATIYYGISYNKKALDDYLKILGLGDSSFLYLKRAGIGYYNNMQPKEALVYLKKATVRDTTDYETLDIIAKCYQRLGDNKNCIRYYDKVAGKLAPMTEQEGITRLNLGQVQASDSLYSDAVLNYIRCYDLTKNHPVLMLIANCYDENMKDPLMALPYYRQFMSNLSESRRMYTSDYIDAVRQRLAYLEKNQAELRKGQAKK